MSITRKIKFLRGRAWVFFVDVTFSLFLRSPRDHCRFSVHVKILRCKRTRRRRKKRAHKLYFHSIKVIDLNWLKCLFGPKSEKNNLASYQERIVKSKIHIRSEAKVPAAAEEREQSATQVQLPTVSGEGEGAEEAPAEERNQALRQPNRIDLRGGGGDLNPVDVAHREPRMHHNRYRLYIHYQLSQLSLDSTNKDFLYSTCRLRCRTKEKAFWLTYCFSQFLISW